MQTQEKKVKRKRTLLQKIVNTFLYFWLGILILMIVAFGISQTSTFREYLREMILEEVNASLNGKLNIERIDGTLFTSVILNNTSVLMESDTLFSAKKIEVRISPLRIFLKTIYARKIEIAEAKINLVKDSNGILNVEKLVPASTEEDTTSSEFPFSIEVADLKLINIDFMMCDYNKTRSTEFYDEMNPDDFRIKNLNLSVSAYANIKENEFEIAVNHIELLPNINDFNLKNFSGRFAIVKDHIEVRDLNLKTGMSDINLSAELTGFNLFDSTSIKNLGKSDLKLNLQANPFSFHDLSSFIPSVKFLNGNILCAIDMTGKVDEVIINSLQTEFNDTKISLKGYLKDLSDPGNMFISADFFNSQISQPDINYLMPELNIPLYEQYGIIYFDTLSFIGKPLDFKSNLAIRTSLGSLSANTKLKLSSDIPEYEIIFNTKKFDISPFAGLMTNLNTYGSIKGKSFDVTKIAAQVAIDGNGSSIDQNVLDICSIEATAGESKINYKLLLNSDSTQVDIAGSFDFTIAEDPAYNLEGNFRHINLGELLRDTTTSTDININLIAEGQGFNPDSMNLFIISTLYNSVFDDIKVDTTQAIVDIIRQDGDERIINIVSDLADITITGDFSITETAVLLADEAGLISTTFIEKINEIVPPDFRINSDSAGTTRKNYFSDHSETSTTLNYVIEFKDFTLLTLLLRGKELELDGDISGEFTKTPEDLFFRINTKLDYIKYWTDNNVLLASQVNVGLTLANNFTSTSFNDINTGLRAEVKRIYTGNNFHDILLDLKIKNEIASINFKGRVEDYLTAALNGNINLAGNTARINFDSLFVMYNDYKIKNKGSLALDYSGESVRINNFIIEPEHGQISLEGFMNSSGSQNIKLVIDQLDVNDILVDLIRMNPASSPGAEINLTTIVTGTSSSPIIRIDSSIDSIEFRNKKFGSLVSSIDYENKNLRLNSYFVDALKQFGSAELRIRGNAPIDLSFTTDEERLSESAPISLRLLAKDFNLAAFGDLLPQVDKLNGILEAEIELSGNKNTLKPEGYLTISDAAFVAEANNLGYHANVKITMANDSVKIENIVVENQRGIKDGGRITGSGVITLDGLSVAETELYMNGSLKVLGKESRSVSPAVYGDLVIATKGYIELRSDKSGTFLSAPLKVNVANLIFPPTQSAYNSGAENIIYRFKVDTSLTEKKELDIDKLIEEDERRLARGILSDTLSSRLDYSISIDVEKEATIVFVLSKELNQNLTAVLNGDLNYQNINGKSIVTGRLKLLEGSTLQFFKSFDAAGTIRFDADISNPYLDISAAYRDYYSPSDSASTETEVAVKIKISGPLRDLDKNFIQEKNNIAVYVGTDNIEDDIPDNTKTQSDAIMFILTGKFASEATAQDKSVAAGQFSGTATSLAGSLLGGVLNSYFGEYVRRVELRTVGAQTKFNLSGRVDDFRYTIGGATDVFQDLSRANIKIEYPLLRNLLIRLERKEALADTYISNEMINELGLKYRFEF